MKIAVLGAGGVGGWFGTRLAGAGADVHLIARGAHLEAIRKHGLRIRSSGGDEVFSLPVTDDPVRIGTCDLVLVCVKSYDTEAAAEELPALLQRQSAVLSLQNGIDNEEKLAASVGIDRVMGGVAFIFASIAEPGVVVHAGGPASLVFGELDGSPSARGERLLALCRAGGVPAELVPDIRVRLWDKLAFICAQAGMTACTRLPIGEIRERPEAWAMFRRIVGEVVGLARAEGVGLAVDTAERIALFARGLEPTGYSSLYHDLVGGRRMELEALHGLVVRRSRAHGLEAPMCEAVYALLEPHAARVEPRPGS